MLQFVTIDLQKPAPLKVWSDAPDLRVEKSAEIPSWIEWECRLRAWEGHYSWNNHHFFSDHTLSSDNVEQYTRNHGRVLAIRLGSSLATAEPLLAELRTKNPEASVFFIEFENREGTHVRAILAPNEFITSAKWALGLDQSCLEHELNLSTTNAFDPWAVVFDSGRWTIGALERAEGIFRELFAEKSRP